MSILPGISLKRLRAKDMIAAIAGLFGTGTRLDPIGSAMRVVRRHLRPIDRRA
jgi:hypothetical protein